MPRPSPWSGAAWPAGLPGPRSLGLARPLEVSLSHPDPRPPRPADPAALSARVKALAHGLGFDLVGIARAEPSRQLAHFRAWCAEGHAGEMAYLTRPEAAERRADPRTSLPDARSVVVVALDYTQPPAGARPPVPSGPAGPRGRVAQYARNDDYHEVLAARLRALAAAIEADVGSPLGHRVYVDTGPLLERELAALAGLGWQGKHTCLIHPRRGSHLVLGELLLALELAPDPPFTADHCGTCRRCLDACPTGALVEPRRLDARRCLSYLTIELKGPIPRELRPALGDWIFGCDICQDVCPWNRRFGRPTDDPALLARDDLDAPDLPALLALDDAGFRARFRGSPIKRAKRRGLLRNVAVALGNSNDPAALAPLAAALDDPEPLVRGHAAWALGRLARLCREVAAEAAAALERALEAEADASVRAELASALDAARTEPTSIT